MKISAGIIYYKFEGVLKIFLAHSTGHKNIYSFPKGELDKDESIFNAALREFEEETEMSLVSYDRKDYYYLGCIKQNKDKYVHAFAIEADIDPENCNSNWCEFPEGTGRWIPEIDDYHWFTIDEALKIINPRQISLLEKLIEILN